MAFFYHLPKVHKDLSNPPGRPIISGINSCTSQLSQYLDIYLQDYVKELPSYLRDSESLIRLLKTSRWVDDLRFVTMDVTALYSNIEHSIDMKCIAHYLREDKEISPSQQRFLLDALHLILYENYFTYNGVIYQQVKGMAMWTRMAPSYANLFMGRFENEYIYTKNPYKEKIMCY